MIFASKEKEFCGGKLILTNFKKKKINGEIFSISPNGTLFLNSRFEGIEIFVSIFESFIPVGRYALDQYGKRYRKMYPGLKSFDDLSACVAAEKDKTKIAHMIATLLIPIEVRRREIERAYYNKRK